MNKITGNEPAHGFGCTTADGSDYVIEYGLSKYEYFSAMALQGLLSNAAVNNPKERHNMMSVQGFAETATIYATSLIKSLETLNTCSEESALPHTPSESEELLQKDRREIAEKAWDACDKFTDDTFIWASKDNYAAYCEEQERVLRNAVDKEQYLNKNYPLPKD